MNRPVVLVAAASVTTCLAALTSSLQAQSASLVYRLGKDTVAIEQYTRSATALSGELVQRSGPAITRLTYDVTIGADGRPTAATFKRLAADGTPLPTGPRETRLQLRADSAIREVVFADSVQRRAFAAPNALLISPTFAYGLTELIALAGKGGGKTDSLPAIGMTGNVGYAGLVKAGGDTVRLRGGGYEMRLRFDGNQRLQSVDGSFTTNKAIATRANGGLNMNAIAGAMKPAGVLSSRGVARGAFGTGGIVLIDYGRPSVRGRTVWGGTLIPMDSIWRAGANDATHLFTTRTLEFAGSYPIPAGQYTLFIQPALGGTFLYVNKQTGQWGTQYDKSQDVLRYPLSMKPTDSFVEELTVTIRNTGGMTGEIEFAWGDKKAVARFTAKQ